MSREALTADPQLDALLRQIAAVSAPPEPAPPPEPPLPAGARIGPYRIVELAGAGGMGVVYRAYDERLTREVALKLLPKGAGAPEQLLHEARAAASLSHPNLASVYEAGSLDGHGYFAMELVRGSSLRALISAGSGTPAERLEWALGLAKGLAAIHRAGWIHRDVKPENVMVTADGVAKLLDLGLASAASSVAVQPAGTPGYMSPEQLRGEALDARSDVWALGCVLRELRGPERVTRRCLDPQRERRLASAAEVVTALEEVRAAPRRWPLVLAAVLLLAAAAALAAWPKRPAPAPKAARRLTGHSMSRPISDAALSADGRRFAYVDDEGLFLGDPANPERVQRVALAEEVGSVEPGAVGFHLITHGADGQPALWHLSSESAQPELIYRGAFKFASPSARRDRIVSIEGQRVVVRRTSDGAELSAVTHPPERLLMAARWCPAGELYALASAERLDGDTVRSLTVWAPGGAEPLWSVRTQRLAQGYVPVVFGWSARGALLYALADVPGEGDGAAVWSLERPGAEPRELVHVDGNVFATLGESATGQLLTVRETVHLRAQLADVAESGALSNARALTESDLDERPTGWESPGTVLLSSPRNFVPHLARRELGKAQAEWVDGKGWAQTWPTATGRAGELLYWWAEKNGGWQLALRADGAERAVELPGPVRGEISTTSPPPYAQRVRCALSVRACVLARVEAGRAEVYDLSLDRGAPVLRFAVPAPATGSILFAVSADAERVVLADAESTLRVYDRSGAVVDERRVPEVGELRGLAFDAPGSGFYVSGLGADWVQRVGWLPAGGSFQLLQSAPSALAELWLSPDRRRLAYLEKQFDSDLWLTPME